MGQQRVSADIIKANSTLGKYRKTYKARAFCTILFTPQRWLLPQNTLYTLPLCPVAPLATALLEPSECLSSAGEKANCTVCLMVTRLVDTYAFEVFFATSWHPNVKIFDFRITRAPIVSKYLFPTIHTSSTEQTWILAPMENRT